jgi:hypothetical protein
MAKPPRFDETFENSQPLVAIEGRDRPRCRSHDLKRRLTSAGDGRQDRGTHDRQIARIQRWAG